MPPTPSKERMNLIDNLMDAKDSEDIPLLAVQPNQVSVNDYEPGVGIGWHKDIDDLGLDFTHGGYHHGVP